MGAKRISADRNLYPFLNRLYLFCLKSKLNDVFTLNNHQTSADSLFLSVSRSDLSAGDGKASKLDKKAKTSLFEEVL